MPKHRRDPKEFSDVQGAFAQDVARERKVYTVQNDEGVHVPKGFGGRRVMPFWSSQTRVMRALGSGVYDGYSPRELSWEEFRDVWLPGMVKDNLLVGINWTTGKPTPQDAEPDAIRGHIQQEIDGLEGRPKRRD